MTDFPEGDWAAFAEELSRPDPKPLVPLAPADQSAMPEEFARSTMLALQAQQEILALALDEDDPHYEAKLRAKAAASGQQINAQLKADDQRLRGQLAVTSYYQELKKALANYYSKKDS